MTPREPTDPFTREELLDESGIAPRYRNLVGGWLDALLATGHLRSDSGQRLAWRSWWSVDDGRAALERARRERPHKQAWHDLVERCAGSLGEVITGRQEPLELFSEVLESSSDRPQDDVGPSTGYRTILRAGIESIVASIDPLALLDVLEVGGGTGIATSEVIPLLPPERTRYDFTDVSPLFLVQARQKFGKHTFVNFEPLDLERPPAEQWHAKRAYDVVIAVDVLHATRSIPRALAHVRSMLAPGGLLLIAELTRAAPSFAMTYGLLMKEVEGPGRSAASPFLSRDAWLSALRAAGFARATAVPHQDDRGSCVFVAQSPASADATRQAFEGAPPADGGDDNRPPVPGFTKKADLADWFYVPSWRRSSPLAEGSSPIRQTGRWIVFLDTGGIGLSVSDRLAAEGGEVVTVEAGEQFMRKTERAFVVDANRLEDYERLVQEVDRAPLRGQPAMRIVHLWGLAPPAPRAKAAAHAARPMPFDSLVFLAKSLGTQSVTEPVHVWVVSGNAYEVTGGDVCPRRALLSAPCKVIPLEYPNVTCTSVDFDLRMSSFETDVGTTLLEELRRGPTDGAVAYRGAHRWIPSFEPIRLPASTSKGARLKEKGVYLITGGTGRIGLSVAQNLATEFHARLILTRRSAFPTESDWERWVEAHGEDDPTSQTIRVLHSLVSAGAEVTIESADVSDLGQMRAVVERALRRFGRIDGVIHSAGVLGDGAIQQKSIAEIDAVLAPKVGGALVLEELFAGTDLDFLVAFSSVSAISPGFGQVAYAAANAFLDAFVLTDVARRQRYVSCISWDVWQGDGMAYDAIGPAVLQRVKEEDFRRRGILPHEGVQVFRRALESGLRRVIVSTSDYLEALQAHGRDLSQLYSEALAKRGGRSSRHARPALAVAYAAPETESERALAEIWQELLGLDCIGADDDFFELGGDSLIGTQVITRIKRGLGASLSTRAVYAHPTIRRMARAADEALLSDAGVEGISAALDAIRENE